MIFRWLKEKGKRFDTVASSWVDCCSWVRPQSLLLLILFSLPCTFVCFFLGLLFFPSFFFPSLRRDVHACAHLGSVAGERETSCRGTKIEGELVEEEASFVHFQVGNLIWPFQSRVDFPPGRSCTCRLCVCVLLHVR